MNIRDLIEHLQQLVADDEYRADMDVYVGKDFETIDRCEIKCHPDDGYIVLHLGEY